ncbi:MAG TPA: EamA family transporter [Candidatus Thermoplasmatota archaeon]|nr:EamA family transporter [Candidatus Thermoplasmatota archaeon]
MGPLEAGKASRGRVWLAFASVYVIWGTTYLAIAYVIDTMPSLLAMGVRYLLAGSALWMLAPGSWRTRPTPTDWKWGFILGALLLLAGNGIVSIVEGKMPSGVTALLIGVVPLWMTLIEWATGGGRPTALSVSGILLGFAGVGLLAGEGAGWVGGRVDPLYVGGLLFGCLCWAFGSVLSRRGGIKMPILRSVALQMMCGSLLLFAVGLLRGEASAVHLDQISMTSLVALAYLVTFGSIVAFSAYSWLLSVRPAVMVSTYAFVNPVVAVFLGALVRSEPLTQRTLLATVLIVGAVALVLYAKARPAAAKPLSPAPAK